MLTRAFRVTDKLGNALLRISAWTAMTMTGQIATLKHGLIGVLVTLWQAITNTFVLILGIFLGTARRTRMSMKSHRMSSSAARTHGTAPRKPISKQVAKDPLLAQNRALSAFAVLLLIVLLFFGIRTNEKRMAFPGRRRGPVAAGRKHPRTNGPVPNTDSYRYTNPRSAACGRQHNLYPARKRANRYLGD
jgi:hypothetical protein